MQYNRFKDLMMINIKILQQFFN